MNQDQLIEFVLKKCSDMEYHVEPDSRFDPVVYDLNIYQNFDLERLGMLYRLLEEKFSHKVLYYPLDSLTIDCVREDIELPEGILEYIDLRVLYIEKQNLNHLPKLPKKLEYLNVSDNNLTELPELPDTLETLYCGYNKLSELPKLPQSLEKLHIKGNTQLLLLIEKFRGKLIGYLNTDHIIQGQELRRFIEEYNKFMGYSAGV